VQIPTTLPTLDELLGLEGRSAAQAVDEILGLLKGEGTDVYALHTEVEGGALEDAFEAFLRGLAGSGRPGAHPRGNGCRNWLAAGPPAKANPPEGDSGRARWVSFEAEVADWIAGSDTQRGIRNL